MRLVPRIFGQALGLVALSAVLAFAVNAARPDGLPLAQAAAKPAPSAVQLSQASGEIALKDAALLFLSGRAVFLDARSQFEFQLGHIQGALSLPPRNFAADFQDIKPLLAGKEAVIAYCDGPDCPLSHSLAKHLIDAGVKNVYVLVNGWSLWQAEKLPVAKGAPAPISQTSQAPQAVQTTQAPQAVQTTQAAQTVKKGKASASKAKGQEKLCTDCTN
jgi:rhodanese-related sulfurtransferase